MGELKKCRAWHKVGGECWFTLTAPDCDTEPCLVEIDGDDKNTHNCLVNLRRIVRPDTKEKTGTTPNKPSNEIKPCGRCKFKPQCRFHRLCESHCNFFIAV